MKPLLPFTALLLLTCSFVFFPGKDTPAPPIPHQCFDAWNDSSANDLSILDTVVPKYRLIMVGEVHGVAVNPRIQLKMIRYLYTHAHMRHLVLEYGPAETWLMQKYLDTGDESWMADSWQFKMPEYVRFWRELYAFNKTLDEKIDLTGIDFDNDHLFARVLFALSPEKKNPDPAIAPMIDSIRVYNKKVTSFLDRNFIDQFHADYTAHYQQYKDFFGENFGMVIILAENMSSYDRMKDRDHQMTINFTDYATDTTGYFGMFGWEHAYIGYDKAFATILNTSEDYETFNGKVLSIGICYDSCSYYYRYQSQLLPQESSIMYMAGKSSVKMVNRLKAEAGCNSAIFAVRAVNDPLAKEASRQADYLMYVRKSKEVGFVK